MKLIFCLALVVLVPDEGTELGSTKYKVSADQPVGWRGDGTGRFPGANPPLTWERVRQGNGYATRNLIWATPLPPVGISSPIVVGGRIFLTAGFTDLLCLDKATGRILWLRSHPEVARRWHADLLEDPAWNPGR